MSFKTGIGIMAVLVVSAQTAAFGSDFVCNAESLALLSRGDQATVNRYIVARNEAVAELDGAIAELRAAYKEGESAVKVADELMVRENRASHIDTQTETQKALNRIKSAEAGLDTAEQIIQSFNPCDKAQTKLQESRCQLPSDVKVLGVQQFADSIGEILSHNLFSIRYMSGENTGTQFVRFPDGSERISKPNGFTACIDANGSTVWASNSNTKLLQSSVSSAIHENTAETSAATAK